MAFRIPSFKYKIGFKLQAPYRWCSLSVSVQYAKWYNLHEISSTTPHHLSQFYSVGFCMYLHQHPGLCAWQIPYPQKYLGNNILTKTSRCLLLKTWTFYFPRHINTIPYWIATCQLLSDMQASYRNDKKKLQNWKHNANSRVNFGVKQFVLVQKKKNRKH